MNIVFGKTWFKTHQRKLLFLLKFKLFKWILRIDTKEEIIGILPNAYFVKGQNPNEYIADFRTHNKYAKRLYYAFKPIWHLIHFWDMTFANQISQQLNFGFDTLTVYPEPGVTVSGRVSREGVDQTLTNIRAGAGTNEDDTTDTPIQLLSLLATATTDQYERLVRGIALFDTSALPASPTISAAVFSLYITAKGDTLGAGQSVGIVASTPASDTALATTDYANVGAVRFATDVTIASITTTAYNDWTLNATGIAAISDSGITKLGYKLAADIDNSASWAGSGQARINGYIGAASGNTNDPKLVITYTSGGGSNTTNFFF